MSQTAGWNIWGYDGALLRQFTVAKGFEADALALLKTFLPHLKIASRHAMDHDLIGKLGLASGNIIEWIQIDPKQPLTRPGGVPIDQPMPDRAKMTRRPKGEERLAARLRKIS